MKKQNKKINTKIKDMQDTQTTQTVNDMSVVAANVDIKGLLRAKVVERMITDKLDELISLSKLKAGYREGIEKTNAKLLQLTGGMLTLEELESMLSGF